MHLYCKAYLLRDLRRFAGWHEPPPAEGERRADEAVVYLRDDYTVVDNPVVPENECGIVFATVTPEWQQFCIQTLQFAVPDDVREMNRDMEIKMNGDMEAPVASAPAQAAQAGADRADD